MSGLAGRIAALAPEQRALFERLRRQQQRPARLLEPPPIQRLSGPHGEGDWPLSLDQERFWFMEQLYANQAGLNITAATRMRGPLAAGRLAAALAAVVRRHAAWRTTFPVPSSGRPGALVAPVAPPTPAAQRPGALGGGPAAPAPAGPVQRVAAPQGAGPRLAVIDLSALPAARREPLALRLVSDDTAAPFDLARGPLLRSSLVRLGAEDHLCVLTVHHLVTDWISFQIAWAELAAIYQALAAGGRAALPAPPVHYPDFAVWQRGWLQGEVLAELVAWWRERLAGVPLALELPLDRPRPPVARMRGGRRQVAASRQLSEALRALARRQGATLFMAVLAATAALLHRDSGQERLILGANNANRNRPEIEPVVGCFLTQVPFVVELDGDPTWGELLARVRQSALGSFGHQDLPFGKLVEAVQPPRDASRQPLVQALVQVLDGQQSPVEIAGVTFAAVDSWDGKARYDLMLNLYDAPAGIAGTLEYDADLFDAATAERLVERLLLQAAAACADPGLRLSQLPVLTAAARHQTVIEWGDAACPAPAWTVPARFAEQAARTPEALAVVAAGDSLTYGGLARRAGALARRLRAAGIAAGSRVALALARGLDEPVAMLAVWQAGGAWVPLDLGSPADRLAWLLADAAPVMVVHRGALPVALPEGVPALDLGAVASDLEAAAPHPNAAAPHPDAAAGGSGVEPRSDDLAYLIYTSGTTGRPKAVMVEHGSLAAMLGAAGERLAVAAGDRIPHLSRPVFDLALLEIFLPLLAGGAVEIVPDDELLEIEHLAAAIERATCMLAVPAHLRRLAAAARAPGAARFAGLRAIVPGGEQVTPELQRQLLESFPGAVIDVMYGPTEAAIVCTAWRVPRWRRPELALIGWPLPGVETRVVDRRLAAASPVAPGVPGELWIGGRGVARGYFRRPELSAERFVQLDGRRFYRSGDLVRQVPAWGGALEFLGRIDQQVKVRGVRIEPAEIEAALLSHPRVAEAVVVARPDRSGDNRLLAYWAPATAAAATRDGADGAGAVGGELLAHLRARLPAALIPAALVALPELPRNAAGKVDRARLPEPAAGGGDDGGGGAGGALDPAGGGAPRTPVEEVVAAIWCEVLGLRQVSVRADFFALGGHSLLATQVISRLRAATGVELAVGEIFQSPTVEALAGAVTAALSAGTAASAAPPIRRLPRGGELPLSFAQERLWFLDRLAPGSAAYNIPLALHARGALSLPALAAALGEMVRRHEPLRTTYRLGGAGQDAGRDARGGRPVQVIAPALAPGAPGAPGAPAASAGRLPVVDLAGLPAGRHEAEVRRVIDEEVARPFDLERDAVLRQLALRLAPAEHVLLVVVHHIAADGWSVGVMLREITALYGAALAPDGGAAVVPLAAVLPELAVQYADFAVWQRDWLRGEVLERQLAYWRERLAGAAALDLPADRPRPPAQSFRGATRMHAVPPAAAAAVARLARQGDATLFMVLLAAVQTLLGRYAGSDDVVVGSPIANRTRAELEPLIGFFVNSLVLRGDLAGDPPFAELLARSRRAALGAYSHQDLPFERLVEALRPERRLAHNPLFQVMFAVQNTPLGAVELPGVAFSAVELTFPAIRFDLEIFFSETESGGLAVQLTYSTDLFDRPTILRLLGHLDGLLAAIVADPARRLSQLPMLSQAERHQLRCEWNDTAGGLPGGDLAARFAQQARRRPDAVALSSERGEVTYGELARRAAAVARRLAAAGVGPEVRVALLAERSPEMVAGILGILAAGGAYVPLDPAYPAERLAFMLADSGARVVLGQAELAARLEWPAGAPAPAASPGAEPLGDRQMWTADGMERWPAGGAEQRTAGGPEQWASSGLAPQATAGLEQQAAGAMVRELGGGVAWLDLAGDLAAGEQTEAGLVPVGVPLDGLAYVMYTSGSTGRPKGVGITHRAVARLVAIGEPGGATFGGGESGGAATRGGMPGAFATLGPEQVFLQLAPISFDASTLELWAPLLNGGRLALFPPRRPSLEDVAAAVTRWGVTSLWLTAGLFHQMVDHQPAALAHLDQLLAGGDVLSPPHVRRARAALPAVTLINGYGPTEGTTFTCCHRVAAGEAVGESVPLGRPIGNTEVHLLGPRGEALPAGVWGELWVGGAGLARGYLGRPELTAASFAPHPWGSAPGGRLYRTGDVARWRPDGRIEFRGRRDGQVKVRGYRVELGEVESALARHPRVKAAAVIARRRSAGSAGSAEAMASPPPAAIAPGAESAAPADGAGAAGGDLQLVAYVVPAPAAAANLEQPEAAVGHAAGLVEQWRELYDQTYDRGLPAEAGGDAGFNVQGWNSSYSGAPIPAVEMREWLEGIAGRLLALPHRRVLEVGCGTGLLLFRVAPRAARYHATDFSAAVLAQVAGEIVRRGIPGVELEQRTADDWSGIAAGSYDLVVLNSVVQYFPGVDYLVRVLEGAVAAAAPGGAVFIGDVRSLPLLDAFHASVEIHRAADSLPVAELVRRVRRGAAGEQQLLIDPALFHDLRRRLPRLRSVQVQLHRGSHANELTRFRYDVALEVGAPEERTAESLSPAPAPPPRRLSWEADGLSLGELECRLAALFPAAGETAAVAGAALAVAGIPNARLAAEAVALELLAGAEASGTVAESCTVAELRTAIARRLAERAPESGSAAVDPEELWALAGRLGLAAEVAWPPAGGADGRIDAVFRRLQNGDVAASRAVASSEAGSSAAASSETASSAAALSAAASSAAASSEAASSAAASSEEASTEAGSSAAASSAASQPAGGAGAGRDAGRAAVTGLTVPEALAAGRSTREGGAPRWSAWANNPIQAAERRRLLPELRRFLEAALPEAMVPSAFVVLDALPLTANGKVDRSALPAPEGPAQPVERWVAPASPLEQLLAEATADVLEIERVGLRDNFFDLGGHSLLATQLVSRLVQEHALPVTLQMVFDAADLGELADRIVESELASADAALLEAALGDLDELAPAGTAAPMPGDGLPEANR